MGIPRSKGFKDPIRVLTTTVMLVRWLIPLNTPGRRLGLYTIIQGTGANKRRVLSGASKPLFDIEILVLVWEAGQATWPSGRTPVYVIDRKPCTVPMTRP